MLLSSDEVVVNVEIVDFNETENTLLSVLLSSDEVEAEVVVLSVLISSGEVEAEVVVLNA